MWDGVEWIAESGEKGCSVKEYMTVWDGKGEKK